MKENYTPGEKLCVDYFLSIKGDSMKIVILCPENLCTCG